MWIYSYNKSYLLQRRSQPHRHGLFPLLLTCGARGWTLRNATVYDAAHEVLAQLSHATLPQRLALPAASQVALGSCFKGEMRSKWLKTAQNDQQSHEIRPKTVRNPSAMPF